MKMAPRRDQSRGLESRLQALVPAEDRDEARAEQEAVRLLATEFIDAGTMGH